MLVTAALAFAAVASGAIFAARGIARKDALAEAQRSARSMADTVFVPMLANHPSGDAAVLQMMQSMVRSQSRDGSMVRVKVWSRDGTVLYSDVSSIVGKRFPAGEDIQAVIDQQQSRTDLSTLDSAENATETASFDQLVEVYTPMTLTDGSRVALEIYSTDARIAAAEHNLIRLLVPVAIASLVILLASQLPLSMWLVRRVSRAQQDRSRLLRDTLIASTRERQEIARDLHDGVVQDLAGAGYAVAALASGLPDGTSPSTKRTLDRVSRAMQESVSRLRTMMVDIYPPDLSADGLDSAIEELAERLRAHDIAVDVTVDSPVEPAPEVAATLYRCAREGLVNVAKHANARHVRLVVNGDADMIALHLRDDGVGMPPGQGPNGHLGLKLLHDAAVDLGGEMSLASSPESGTTLTMRLPIAGITRR